MAETSAGDDPLIAALIGKLPKTGGAWSRAQRINWLRMLVMAFNDAYGLEEPIAVAADLEARRAPLRLVPVSDVGASAGEPSSLYADAVAMLPKDTRERLAKEAATTRYVIDAEGFAMCGTKPIAPEDIPAGATLWDERQAGEQLDLSSVLWKGEGARDPAKLPRLQVRAA